MKLFYCSAYDTNHEPTSLIVAKTKEEALEKFREELDEYYGWYIGETVQEISEVDGYKIILVKE